MSLDLVLDNPEIRFPEDGPRFRFIYWSHTPDNLPKILPLLENCDTIATEVGYCSDENGVPAGDAVRNEFELLNLELQGKSSKHTRDTMRKVAKAGHIEASIALHFGASGKTIVPIDDFEITTQHDLEEMCAFYPGFKLFLDKRPGYEPVVRQDIRTQITHLRRRENTSLRQLQSLATLSAASGKEETIGVLYGAAHTPLFVAASILGARADRHFVNPQHRTFAPLESLLRKIRYGLGSVDSITDEEIRDACLLEMASVAVNATLGEKAKFIDDQLLDQLKHIVTAGVMKAYRTNRRNCVETLLELHEKMYEGTNPKKIMLMHRAAQRVIELCDRQRRK